jgi:hypothetical protein
MCLQKKYFGQENKCSVLLNDLSQKYGEHAVLSVLSAATKDR